MTALALAKSRAGSAFGIFAVFIVAFSMLVSLAAGEPLFAVAVPIAATVVYGLYKLPLKVGVFSVLFLVLAFEGLQYPLGGNAQWEVPLFHPIAQALFYNLNSLTGVGLLRAPLVDLVTLGLFVVSLTRHPRDGWAGNQPTVRAMHMALWGSAVCAVLLIPLGVAQGGDFDESLWQMRHLLMFPIRAVVIMRALDCEEEELKTIGRIVVGAALVKAAVGLWFFYVTAPAMGIDDLEFTTSHTDTLLFVPALAIVMAQLLEGRSPKAWIGSALWAPIVLWALVCNDRRVSYVSLFIGLAVMLVMSPPTPVKRVLGRVVLLTAPLVPFYIGAGWASNGKGFFFPVGVLKSLIVGEKRFEGAIDYRELENLDVLYTWHQHPVLPAGFGHKFELLFQLPDISSWFETWQYHPHNSYLWLLTIGGPIGFTLMMLPHLATLYLSARAYRFSTNFTQRVALLTGIATVIAFFNQVWGDMGILSWTPSWAAAFAAAIAAKLAMKTAAWPSVMRVRRLEDEPLG